MRIWGVGSDHCAFDGREGFRVLIMYDSILYSKALKSMRDDYFLHGHT